MIALEELKDIVVNNMEQTGYLDNMRAELKSNVYKIIERQDSELKRKSGFQWEHPNLEKLNSMKEGKLGINLIGEFLEHYKLDYTLSVFKKELRQKYFNRDDLIDNLNMKHHPNHNTSVLLHIIQDYMRIMEMGYSGMSQRNNNNNQNHFNNNNNYNSYNNNNQNSNSYNDNNNNFDGKKTQSEGFFKKSKSIENSQESDRQYNNDHDKPEQDNQNNKPKEETQEEKQRKIKEWQEEQDRIEYEKEQQLKREEEERERERVEKIERQFKEMQEKERLEEEEAERKKKEKEEKRQKEKEKRAKQKKLPKTAVNKIRGSGGLGQDQDALAFLYGSAITGQPQQQYDEPYDENDPYAYDVGGDPYGGEVNDYNYDISGPINNNKFGGDPYANIDLDAKVGEDKKEKDIEDEDYYLDEEIDYMDDDVQNNYKNDKDRKNPMFTSSEDYYGASQSQGFDQSVDSDAIELYDHYERIKKN